MLKTNIIKNVKIKNNENKIVNVSSKLTKSDIIGSWKARWGINRMNFKVNTGLYSIGNPGKASPVLVTANYKMSFDSLRKELNGINAYILVLDTKGINVWCSAAKGIFGTNELLRCIKKVSLSEIITHRTLILPQLGACGISAQDVQKKSGFKVIYGPVRAEDIPEFLKNGLKAEEKMRRVRFNFTDRIVLTPIEIVSSMKISLQVIGVMFLLNLIGIAAFNGIDVIAYLGAVLIGCLFMPILLPYIPVRSFSLKGWLLGMIWTALVIMFKNNSLNLSIFITAACFLILPSISAYYSLNFTGSSTYTSFSGVLKETKITIPFILITIVLGILLLLLSKLMLIY